MMRLIVVSLVLVMVAVVAILGLRGQSSQRPPLQLFNDMNEQPRYKAQGQAAFFADGREMRPAPAGTVAWGRQTARADEAMLVRDEDYYNATAFPPGVRVDRALLERGQMLFTVNCVPCHGGTGSGNGITTQYGMLTVPSYHDDARRKLTVGQIYRTITEGKNTMGPYGDRIVSADRWAVIAYVRALQRARMGTIQDVPEQYRRELKP